MIHGKNCGKCQCWRFSAEKSSRHVLVVRILSSSLLSISALILSTPFSSFSISAPSRALTAGRSVSALRAAFASLIWSLNSIEVRYAAFPSPKSRHVHRVCGFADSGVYERAGICAGRTLPGNGYPVGWTPTTGNAPFVPVSGPGGGNPITGYTPPGTVPSSPFVPISNPTIPVTPTTPDNPPIVVGSPPKPTTPSDPTPSATPTDPASFWTPWPLPPRNRSAAVSNDRLAGLPRSAQENRSRHGRPMRSTVQGGSRAEHLQRESAGLPGRVPDSAERVGSAPSTPSEDLKYRGGRTIQNLSFVNLYVGGNSAWQKSDIESIDRAISAAMADRNLNNVMRQYFNNAEITGTELPSHPLVGYTPSVMSQGDVEYCLSYLYDQGYLVKYDLSSTVFNFLLPPGTVLNDEAGRHSTLALATQDNDIRAAGSTFTQASSGG